MRLLSYSRLLVVCIVSVALVAVLVAVFAIVSPAVETELVRAVAERSGIALESERFGVVPHRGWVARGVEATALVGGQRVVARVPRLIFGHRWSPLLGGRLIVDGVRLEEPKIELVSTPAGMPASPFEENGRVAVAGAVEAGKGPGRLALEVERLVLRDALLVSRMAADETQTTELRGLDLTLEEPRLTGGADANLATLSGRGELRAGRLSVGRFGLEEMSARFEVERGRFRLHDIDIWSVPSGMSQITVDRLEVDLAQSPYRYRLELVASGIDPGEWLDAAPGFGPAVVELRGGGEGPGLSGAVAEMSIAVEAGTLPDLPALERLDDALGTEFVGAAYEAFTARVALSSARLGIDSCRIVSRAGRLEPLGEVALDGSLALALTVALGTGTARTEQLSSEVVDRLTGRDGWLRLPLRLTGTWSRPRLAVDPDSLGRLLGRRGRTPSHSELAIRSELERWLRSAPAFG